MQAIILDIRCEGRVLITVLLVLDNSPLLYLRIIMTSYDVLLFRLVKVKLLSLVGNVVAPLVGNDIVTNCDATPHTG